MRGGWTGRVRENVLGSGSSRIWKEGLDGGLAHVEAVSVYRSARTCAEPVCLYC